MHTTTTTTTTHSFSFTRPLPVLLLLLLLLAAALLPARADVRVAIGLDHACLVHNGVVRCHGAVSAALGEPPVAVQSHVGDNDSEMTSIEALRFSDSARAVGIAAGDGVTCALFGNGQVRCWGVTTDDLVLSEGQTDPIGDDSGELTTVPYFPFSTSLVQLAVGHDGRHACALATTGKVYCWGKNDEGQLGLGSTANRGSAERRFELMPFVPFANSHAATKVDVATEASCALFSNGKMKCWGTSVSQLGYNTNPPTPIGEVAGDIEALDFIDWTDNNPIIDIGVGYSHLCAMWAAGVRCLGNSVHGQLGYNSDSAMPSPSGRSFVDFHPGFSNPLALFVDWGNTCIIVGSGGRTASFCWGNNALGQLGIGSTAALGDSSAPLVSDIDVIDFPSVTHAVVGIAIGRNVICHAFADDSIRCLGDGQNAVRGDDTTGDEIDSTDVTPLKLSACGASAASGYFECYDGDTDDNDGCSSSCIIEPGFVCPIWSSNCELAAATVAPTAPQCGVRTSNSIYIDWAAVVVDNAPVTRFDIHETISDTERWSLTASTPVFLWNGLAPGTTASFRVRTVTDGGVSPWSAVSTACATLPSVTSSPLALSFKSSCTSVLGTVRCWGHNNLGQLGQGLTVNLGGLPGSMTNIDAVDFAGTSLVQSVAGTHQSFCSVFDNGKIRCWGAVADGALGGSSENRGDTTGEMSNIDFIAFSTSDAATSVAVGTDHACAVFANGRMRCWGRGIEGENGFGDGSGAGLNAPGMTAIQFITFSDTIPAVGVSCGTHFTCALFDNGGIRCWGDSSKSQLGIPAFLGDAGLNSTIPMHEIVYVPFSDAIAATHIASGPEHTCAAFANGGVRCWGVGGEGRLGTNSTATVDDTASLGYVAFSAADFAVKVAASATNSCMLTILGRIRCWGDHNAGIIGDTSITSELGDDPGEMALSVYVPFTESVPVVHVDMGEEHACALFADSQIRCWGQNGEGQLGIESGAARIDAFEGNPIDLGMCGQGDSSSVAAFECDDGNNVGSDGCSGCRVDPGAFCNADVPSGCVLTPNPPQPVVCLRATGISVLLGWNPEVDPLYQPDTFSVDIDGTGGVSNLDFEGMALVGGLVHNTTYTFRVNAANGGGTSAWSEPVQCTTSTVAASNRISTSSEHSCHAASGVVKCWGKNDKGQLGIDNTNSVGFDSSTLSAAGGPSVVFDDTIPVTHISTGAGATFGLGATCSLHANGGIRCWGDNNYGQIAAGSTQDIGSQLNDMVTLTYVDFGYSSPAVYVTMSRSPVSKLACAIFMDGGLRCWGDAAGYMLTGQGTADPIGNGANPVSNFPNIGFQTTHGAVDVSIGTHSVCAVFSNGGLRCWGSEDNGVCGTQTVGSNIIGGLSMNTLPFLPFAANAGAVLHVGVGNKFTCVLFDTYTVRCFGRTHDVSGRLGGLEVAYGSGTSGVGKAPGEMTSIPPVQFPPAIGLPRMLSVGEAHSCVLGDNGKTVCWGTNENGQLGTNGNSGPLAVIGTNSTTALPDASAIPWPSSSPVVDISSGKVGTCALFADNTVRCIGGPIEILGVDATEKLGDTPGEMATLPTVPLPTCGSGDVASLFQCNDGNTLNGDGCSSICTIESGFVCDSGGGVSVCQSAGGVFDITSGDVSVTEGDSATIVVERTGLSDLEIVVTACIGNFTALSGHDFVEDCTDLTFSPGVTSQNYNVFTVNDAVFDLTKQARVDITNAFVGTVGTVFIEILDDGDGGVVMFADNDVYLNENGPQPVCVFLDRLMGSSGEATVRVVNSYGGTATENNIAPFDELVTFADGQTEACVNVTAIDDIETLSPPGFHLTATFLVHKVSGTVQDVNDTVDVIFEDLAPTVSHAVANVSVFEDVGSAMLNFTRNVSADSALVLFLTVSSETASETIDFAPSGNNVTFVPGEWWALFNMTIVNDAEYELPEYFRVDIDTPGNGVTVTGDPSMSIYILDDGDAGVLQFDSDVALPEDNFPASITIVRNHGTSGNVEGQCCTIDGVGTAVPYADYNPGCYSFSFLDGESTTTCSVPVLDNDYYAGPSTTFVVNISDVTGGASVNTSSLATVSILDDNDAGFLGISSATPSPAEGDTITVQVTRSGGLSGQVFVDLMLSPCGFATNGSDFVFVPQTVEFADGSNIAPGISVSILLDDQFEPTEAFCIDLVNPVNATIASSTLTVTINNVLGTVSVSLPDPPFYDGFAIPVNVSLSWLPEVFLEVEISHDCDSPPSPSPVTFSNADMHPWQTIDLVCNTPVQHSVGSTVLASGDTSHFVTTASPGLFSVQAWPMVGAIPFGGVLNESIASAITLLPNISTVSTSDVVISASAVNNSIAIVPAAVVIPAGQLVANEAFNVTIIDQDIDFGGIATVFVAFAANSSDFLFDGSLARWALDEENMVALLRSDDETAGLSIVNITDTVRHENDTTPVEWTLVLESMPRSSVTIDVTVASTRVSGAPSSVTFDAGNWSSPQTVSATANDDNVDMVDFAGNALFLLVASGDPLYDLGPVAETTVTVLDDDVAGLVFSTVAPQVWENDTGFELRVRLATEPQSGVAVSFASIATFTAPPAISFSVQNWSSDKVVTLAPVNDDVDQGNRAFDWALSVSSVGDAFYSALSPTLSVTIIDDDPPAFQLAPASVSRINRWGNYSLDLWLDVLIPEEFVDLDVTFTGAAFDSSLISIVPSGGRNASLFFSTESDAVGTISARVALTFASGVSEQTATFTLRAFPAPTITAIQPVNGPAVGGRRITISGTYLARSPESLVGVTVGGNPCSGTTFLSDTVVTCSVPPGVGNSTVAVTLESAAGSATVASAFSYLDGPVIDAVAPLLANANATNVRVLIETEEAASISSASVAGQTCSSLSISNGTLECIVDGPWMSRTGSVFVTSPQHGTSAAFATPFTWVGPVVESVSPIALPLRGGTTLSVVGSGFTSDANVLLGGQPCPDVAFVNPGLVTCAPGNVSEPLSLSLVVSTFTGGASLPVDVVFSGYRPVTARVVPPGIPLAGGKITIVGDYFGPSPSHVTAVSVAGLSCVSEMWLGATAIECVMPPANSSLSGRAVVTTQFGGISNETASFSYLAPGFILPPPLVTAVAPAGGPYDGGYTITLIGEYLASGQDDIAGILVGGVPCTDPIFVSETELTCVVGAFESSVGQVGVVVDSVSGGTGGTAVGSSIGFIVQELIPRPVDCAPRLGLPSGGDVVTVYGSNFGAEPVDDDDAPVVFWGGLPCQAVEWLDSGRLTCVTPPGSVDTFPVLVDVRRGTQSSGLTALGFRYSNEVCDPPCARRGDCNLGDVAPMCDCWPGAAGERCDLNSIGFRVISGLSSEDGDAAVVELFVAVSPSSDVNLALSSTMPNEVTVKPGTARFESGNAAKTIRVTVTGVDDGIRDGPQAYDLVVTVTSSNDPFYDNAPPLHIPLVNADTPPVIMTLQPAVSPLNGTIVTILGRNFDSDAQVVINGLPVDSDRVWPAEDEASDVRMRQISGDNPDVGTNALAVHLPRSRQGNAIVTVVNAGNAEDSVMDQLFYTDDCPFEGQWGKGSQCKPCPEGATCPGGYRIWAREGYWSPDETSGIVYECDPPERCVGTAGTRGEGSPCAFQYQGDYCGECADGYYPVGDVCRECPAQSALSVLMFGDVVVWSLVGVAGAAIEHRANVGHVLSLILSIQLAGAVGKQIHEYLPDWILAVYEVLYLFSGDVNFVKPDCQGRVPVFSTLFMALGYNIIIGLPLHLITFIALLCSKYKHRDNPESQERRHNHYKDRQVRALTIHVKLIYLSVVWNCLDFLNCRPKPTGDLRLLLNENVVCFEGTHLAAAIMAFVGLLVIGIGSPAFFLYWQRTNRAIAKFDGRFQDRWDLLYEPLRRHYHFFWLSDYVISFVIAFSSTILRGRGLVFLILNVAVTGVTVALVLVKRCHTVKRDNYTTAALHLSNLMATTVAYLARDDILNEGQTFTGVSVCVTLITLTILVLCGVCIYNVFWIRTAKELKYADVAAVTDIRIDKEDVADDLFAAFEFDDDFDMNGFRSSYARDTDEQLAQDMAIAKQRASERLAAEQERERLEADAPPDALSRMWSLVLGDSSAPAPPPAVTPLPASPSQRSLVSMPSTVSLSQMNDEDDIGDVVVDDDDIDSDQDR